MITAARTRDITLIKLIVTDPKTYPYVIDDFSPAPEDYVPPLDDSLYWVVAYRDDRAVGLFLFLPVNGVTLDVHSVVVPLARGTRSSLAAGAAALKWIWKYTRYQRVITSCPAHNPRALTYAKALGLKEFGTNPESYQKNGKLYDIIMLGISRPADCKKEEPCQ